MFRRIHRRKGKESRGFPFLQTCAACLVSNCRKTKRWWPDCTGMDVCRPRFSTDSTVYVTGGDERGQYHRQGPVWLSKLAVWCWLVDLGSAVSGHKSSTACTASWWGMTGALKRVWLCVWFTLRWPKGISWSNTALHSGGLSLLYCALFVTTDLVPASTVPVSMSCFFRSLGLRRRIKKDPASVLDDPQRYNVPTFAYSTVTIQSLFWKDNGITVFQVSLGTPCEIRLCRVGSVIGFGVCGQNLVYQTLANMASITVIDPCEPILDKCARSLGTEFRFLRCPK